MAKTAFLFAGQGSAVTGMGKDIYEAHASAKRVFELVSDILSLDVAKLCFESSNEELALTKNTQPAIFTMSLASCAVLSEHGISPDAVAGFSLGEISALAAAGAVTLEDGARIIKARGECMQRAAEQNGGSMCAILGMSSDEISAICDECEGYVIAVNFNSPIQTVIAGEQSAVSRAAEKCLSCGAKRAVPLAVNAAFHSEMMLDAADEFSAQIASIPFVAPKIPVYSNTTASPIDDFSNMPQYLARQMTSPVQWVKTIQNMKSAGIESVIEHGPGKVLTGLVRRIDKDISCANCDTLAGLSLVSGK